MSVACGFAAMIILSSSAGTSSRDEVTVPAQGSTRAGAASTDITPLPGLPTGGYGPAGVRARGYWGQLRAVAFYFEDPAGRGMALVSADLFAMPSALHRTVAEHFTAGNAGNITGVVLPPERIVLAATHTHQGPGNYLSAEVHNVRGSTKKGFNRPLRGFLAAQIIGAIEQAIVDARHSSNTSVDVMTGNIDATLFRNRSPCVFMRDARSKIILASLGKGIPADAASCVAGRLHDEPEVDWNIDGCPRLRAVDRNVTLLRMRRGGRTHALALFVNVHPTVLAGHTELSSADLFGVARAYLEERFGDNPPVIGFFNGSEGDVVTRRTTRTATDLAALGEEFARQIHRIHESAPATAIDLASGIHGRLHYAHPGEVEPSTGTPKARLAGEAVPGVALIAGAEGDETLFRAFTWWRTRKATGDQGVKVPALGFLRKIVAAPRTFPQALPLGVVRLGTLGLLTTPTENSTAAVMQFREAVGVPQHGALEVISMANEYASYLSTSDEYQVQDYMGASTLWGPQESAFFAAVLGRLYNEPDGTTGAPGEDHPGPDGSFPLGEVGRLRSRPHDGYGDFLKGGFVKGKELPSFQWCESRPTSVGAGDRLVEVVAVDGSLHDRHGSAVILRGLQTDPDRAVWAAIWLTPLWAERRGVYRFQITTARTTIESDSFAVGTSPKSVCSK